MLSMADSQNTHTKTEQEELFKRTGGASIAEFTPDTNVCAL